MSSLDSSRETELRMVHLATGEDRIREVGKAVDNLQLSITNLAP